ncbi:MAG: RIP metalloprotease RseP [candidate division KSB1 bacterium]|nr:RIP metalloprotease RseP [candidate division KSB1 bacterium]MDZ7304605.1 RIP metalloprotease RseP [candidate division KSB1 bacterium]MDZ7313738.1 RIP metalloprotease RseP [candidate division KSB1 bacterium]
MFTLHDVLVFIPVLGLLVFVHELGHFLAAKWAGIRVERFSLGFPPRMFGKKIGDTDYCVSWIPLGGYVKMAGMIDESLDTKLEGQPWEFMSKSIWKRAIVISAGPIMNMVLALAFFTALYFHYGMPQASNEPVVDQVIADSPAEKIGLQSNDRILSVNDQSVETWEQLTKLIHASPEKEIVIEWQRGNEKFHASVVPRRDPQDQKGKIGIAGRIEMRPAGLGESFVAACIYSWDITRKIGRFVGRLVSGKESVREGLAGPVQMMILAGQFAQEGFAQLVNFVALISLQLALLNILPIPALDGGHLLFLGLEAILRRPVSVRVRLVVQQIGMALLLALMIFIVINDFQKIFR